MRFTRIVLVATVCAGSALASGTDSANIAARALHSVAKRDAADDFAAAQAIAMGLAQSAGEAVASGGECSTECNDWVSSMGKCLTATSVSESANCVCADTAITQMGTCGDCLGGENKDGAGSLSKLCSDTTPAAESSATSAASSVASAASEALTSAKSVASSVASSAAAGATGAPASGAGKLAVGGSAILAAGAALLVAL
ncbi:hypothetical protein C6P46_004504 [Rhodotorula mucilaginosa]|uniref:Uncharacterized protein n=1 Tax=Rhodotorula mucilaginosa TaxID=5537 RepID=A0A9P6W0P4_RHOMI|nr:hypothetical protein C6P46_004504 [Rhodotorula mucilaginosa]